MPSRFDDEPMTNDEEADAEVDTNQAMTKNESTEPEDATSTLSPTSRLRKYRTPPPDGDNGGEVHSPQHSYNNSPSSVKRKRMEDLAARRNSKRRL